jgi:hypothetical protein
MEPLALGHSRPMTRNNDDLPQPDGPEIRQPCPLDICGRNKTIGAEQAASATGTNMPTDESARTPKYLQAEISNKSDLDRINNSDVGELCNVLQRVNGIDRTSATTARTAGILFGPAFQNKSITLSLFFSDFGGFIEKSRGTVTVAQCLVQCTDVKKRRNNGLKRSMSGFGV